MGAMERKKVDNNQLSWLGFMIMVLLQILLLVSLYADGSLLVAVLFICGSFLSSDWVFYFWYFWSEPQTFVFIHVWAFYCSNFQQIHLACLNITDLGSKLLLGSHVMLDNVSWMMRLVVPMLFCIAFLFPKFVMCSVLCRGASVSMCLCPWTNVFSDPILLIYI